MISAYDYSFARLFDDAGIDIILVGDSASNVMAGHTTTLPITLDQMIYHAQSVVRARERSLIVVDIPFGYYQSNSEIALASAVRIMKESGANTVKLEGGEEIIESVRKIVSAGIPVMGHLGLTPQSINKFGTYVVRATENTEAEKLKRDALMLQEAGAYAIVLEKIPAALAKEVSESLHIPTIGIGGPAHSHDRHWRRPSLRRTGIGDARYAGHQHRIQTPLFASIPQPGRTGKRCHSTIHHRCKIRGLPQ
jgi:3-methyl-2-oxobutanoate hydroxymethyltransferase